MATMLRVLVSIAVAAALAGCQSEAKAPQALRPVVTKTLVLETTPAERFAGEVASQFETSLSFRVFGRVIEKSVEVGDLVEAGQQIAQIDSTDQQLAVRSARASLDSTQAQFDNLLAVEQRQRTLLEQNNISTSVYETAEQALRAGESALAQAKAELAKAEEQLGYTTLRAEKAGLVTSVDVVVGQTVAIGQSVVTVVQPEFRKAVISVIESEANRLEIGDRFLVAKQLDPSTSLEGTVREIDPQADPVTRTVSVDIDLDDPSGRFRLGSTILATRADAHESMLTVPATAVVSVDADAFVWIVDPSTQAVTRKTVALAPNGSSSFVVTDGLEVGDVVVVSGANTLAEGQKVRVNEGSMP